MFSWGRVLKTSSVGAKIDYGSKPGKPTGIECGSIGASLPNVEARCCIWTNQYFGTGLGWIGVHCSQQLHVREATWLSASEKIT